METILFNETVFQVDTHIFIYEYMWIYIYTYIYRFIAFIIYLHITYSHIYPQSSLTNSSAIGWNVIFSVRPSLTTFLNSNFLSIILYPLFFYFFQIMLAILSTICFTFLHFLNSLPPPTPCASLQYKHY